MQQHQINNNETIFFLVWRNNYLNSLILNNIISKSRDVTDLFPNIEKTINYNSIISLEWMINNNQYEMIIDKIKSGHYIIINNKSIKTLITNCNRYDIYELLFKYKRNDMERVDLIEESVKLNSVFALKSFIQLYGGISSAVISIGIGSEYKSLMDIALSYASLDVANYLLLQPGLDWYTESMLLHNAFSQKEENHHYITKESKKLLNKLKIEQCDQIKTNACTVLENMVLDGQYTENTKVIENLIFKEIKNQINKTGIEKHPISVNVSSNSYGINEVIQFIENKLHHQFDELVNNCKDIDILGKIFKSNHQIDKLSLVDIILNNTLNLNPQECFTIFKSELYVSNKYVPKLALPFNSNYSNHVNHLKYLMLYYSSWSSSEFIETLSFLRSPNKRNIEICELFKELIDQNKVKKVKESFPLFQIYYLDFIFHQNKFKEIMDIQIIENLTTDSVNHLWLLIITNFSVDGLEYYIKYLVKYYTGDIDSNSSKDYNKINKQFNELLCNYQQQQKKPFNTLINLNQIRSFIIELQFICKHYIRGPWEIIFKILYQFYPLNYLDSLILEFSNVRSNFINWINLGAPYESTIIQIEPIVIDKVTCEIQIVKLKLYLKYLKEGKFKKFIKGYGSNQIQSLQTNQKIQLINCLVSTKSDILVNEEISQILLNLLFSEHNGMKFKELSTVYSSLNVKEINSILQFDYSQLELEDQTLENYLFNTTLVNSIFGNERNKIKILSIVNENNERNGKSLQELSSMETDSIDEIFEYIKFIYSNGLVSSFGFSLSLLLIEKLVKEIKSRFGMITMNYENKLVLLVEIINKSKTVLNNHTVTGLYNLSLINGMDRLYDTLMKLKSTSLIEKIDNNNCCNCFSRSSYEYNKIKCQIKMDYFLSFENEINEFIPSFKINYYGHFQTLIQSFISIYDKSIMIDKDSIDLIKMLPKLSIKYCDLSTWSKVYQIIENDLNFGLFVPIIKSNIFKWVSKYNRVDILDSLINDMGYDINKSLDLSFKNGYYEIVGYLLNKCYLVCQDKDKFFNLSLVNGHLNIAKLIISKFNNHHFTISNIQKLLINGNSNILNFIINNNFYVIEKDEDIGIFHYFIGWIKSNESKFIKKLIFDIENDKTYQLKNRVIAFKDNILKNK